MSAHWTIGEDFSRKFPDEAAAKVFVELRGKETYIVHWVGHDGHSGYTSCAMKRFDPASKTWRDINTTERTL